MGLPNIHLLLFFPPTLEDIILSRKCKILRRGQFKVWQKGDLLDTIWIAGQTFERDLGSELSIERMYVISTDKIIRSPFNDPNISANIVETTVFYSNLPHGVAF